MKKIILSLLIISFGLYADPAADKALFDAIDKRSLEGVKKAFEQGASIEAKNEHKISPFFLSLSHYFMSKDRPELQKEHEMSQAIVREIFSHMKTIAAEDFVAMLGFGGLHDLVDKALALLTDCFPNDLPCLEYQKTTKPIVDMRDRQGMTALMQLVHAYEPNMEDIKFLIEKGADVNAVVEDKQKRGLPQRAVLDFALSPGTPGGLKAASYLIDKGAKVTPRHFVKAASAHQPDLELVKKIQEKIDKKDIDAVDNLGWTALRSAIAWGNTNKDIVLYLIDQGANPNAMSAGDPESILFTAIRKFYFWGKEDSNVDLDVIEKFLQKGAVVDPGAMALVRGDYKEIEKLFGPEQGAVYVQQYQQPDPVKKEQIMQLLAKYKKE